MSKQQFQLWFKTLKNLFQQGANSILYRIGRETGKTLLTHLNTLILSDDEAFNYLLLALNKLGWGKYWNTKIESEQITLELHNPIEAYEDRSTSCHYVQGILEGMGEIYMETPVFAIEESCVSQKNRFCTFKIVKREKYLEEWENKSEFDEVLKEFDGKAKSKASFIMTQEGHVLIKHLNEDLNCDEIAHLNSPMLGAATRCSMENKWTLNQLVLMGDKGNLMLKGTSDGKAMVVAILDKNASPGLIGIALKQACEKLEKLVDKYPKL